MQYKVLIHGETYKKVKNYLKNLRSGNITAGYYLHESLDKTDIGHLSVDALIELIFRTKKPQIFAESAIHGNGSDWNQTELSILGDIAVSVPVTVYDDANHHLPKVHTNPFCATLLCVPGALLRNDTGNTPADWDEVTINGCIDRYRGYVQLPNKHI